LFTFTKYINEILSSSYDFSKNEKDSKGPHHYYDFKDENNKSFRVHINHGKHDSGVGDVNFSTGKDKGKGKREFGLTGDSHKVSHKILGTVSSILRAHAQKHGLSHYTFSAKASEPSRVKLYNTITKRHKGETDFTPYNNMHHFIIPSN